MKITVIVPGIILIVKGLNIVAKQELQVPGGKELGDPDIGDPEIIKGTPARIAGCGWIRHYFWDLFLSASGPETQAGSVLEKTARKRKLPPCNRHLMRENRRPFATSTEAVRFGV